MIKLPLKQGGYALIDDRFKHLLQYSWRLDRKGYAVRTPGGKSVKLHRVIMDAPDDRDVDHINHNKLDNRQSNLRVCTRSQNSLNRSKRVNCSSIFKGVYYYARHRNWRAQIKGIHIGYFATETEAATAYDDRAMAMFGKFAKLNAIGAKND